MRAMGPGSVSSLLKIALDVVFVALWAVIGALLLAAVACLLFPVGENLTFTREIDGALREIRLTKPVLAGGLAVAAAYCGIVLFVVRQLRSVFMTLTAGDPFHPGNVNRLRLIGAGLAAMEASNILIPLLADLVIPGQVERESDGSNFTTWLSVLVVFVLAEVFREGARLRREAELTI